jgi:murein DD-endopeptidase MepM/ murein hydrolase activator NlpD
VKRGVFLWLVIGSVSLAAVLAYALPMPGVAAPAASDGAALLAQRSLVIPVAGIRPEALVDTFEQGRPGHRHEAIDIAAPRGTPVHAVDDGKVAKLFTSVPGGLTVYQFDPAGKLAYYYAHLDRYVPGLKEGEPLRRGDVIGYVGSTGNAAPDAPHLHFAVFRLGPLQQWWKGDAINPYPALRNASTAVAER